MYQVQAEFLSAVNNIFSLVFRKCFHWKQFFVHTYRSGMAWYGMVWHRLLNVLGRTYVHTRAQLKNPGNMFHCYFMHLSCCKKLLCMVSFVFFLTLFADPFCILSFWSILNLELSTSHMTQVSRNSIFKPFQASVRYCWTAVERNAQPSSFCISFPCIFQQEVAQTYATHFHTSLRNEYSSSILSNAFNLSHHILYKHCIFVNYSHTHTSTPKSHTHAQNIQAVGIALRRVNFISQKHTMQFKIDERKIAC